MGPEAIADPFLLLESLAQGQDLQITVVDLIEPFGVSSVGPLHILPWKD